MEKSHVTMEQQQCPICTTVEDTGSILLDTRLRKTFEDRTITGWGLCKECKAKSVEYVALVECVNEAHSPAEANRTGNIIHVKRDAWSDIFNVDAPETFAFVQVGVIDMLAGLIEDTQGGAS